MPVMPGSPFDKSCYETITVYRMTRVFEDELWRRHAGGCGRFVCKSERGGA
nr:MAG TPA: hypothetical protein [Caudoviricetes sp.]